MPRPLRTSLPQQFKSAGILQGAKFGTEGLDGRRDTVAAEHVDIAVHIISIIVLTEMPPITARPGMRRALLHRSGTGPGRIDNDQERSDGSAVVAQVPLALRAAICCNAQREF